MQNWDAALEDLNKLKDVIDSSVIHKFLFVFVKHKNVMFCSQCITIRSLS